MDELEQRRELKKAIDYCEEKISEAVAANDCEQEYLFKMCKRKLESSE